MAGIKQPTDKSHFILPDLGEGVHEAELVKWRVKPGDSVDEHQTLAEMETDKALVEVPSPWAGVIESLNGKEGEILNVGSVLVTYKVGSGAAAGKQQAAQQQKEANQQVSESSDEKGEDAGTVVGAMGEMAIPTRFARRTESSGMSNGSSKALATPAVRRIARDAGVDINKVPGTGRGGRVTATDIQAFVTGGDRSGGGAVSAGPGRAPERPRIQVSGDGVAERIPFRGVRRKIAQALDISVKTAVHFTVVDEADVTKLDRKRREYAAVLGHKLSFLPFVFIAVSKALRKHPTLNANVDDANEEILIKSVHNIGCAVDTDHGLMVPVIHDADHLSIVELSEAVSNAAAECRNRTIAREKLVGGTFTISNVGSYGGMFATPIINYPEVAILAPGRAKEQVLTKDGMFYAGKVMPLSLSCDHRVVDGAEGARFLNTVVKLLEDPDRLVG